jgi:pyridoxal phosphate enzyme (YggS family)
MDGQGLAQRLATVKAQLPPGTALVAVSKKRTVAEIKALYDLGHRDFGENYPQELRDKQPLLPADIRWHFIGHLQRNKVKYVVPHAHVVHGADSASILEELDKRAAAAGRTLDVLLQVHIAREETKHGFLAEELAELLAAPFGERYQALRFRGLMGMASNTPDRGLVLSEFQGLAELYRRTKAAGLRGLEHFNLLSMGMSGDFDLALAAGSNMLRIGTAIFGER